MGDTAASNPARIDVDIALYNWCFPRFPLIGIGLLLVGGLLAWKVHVALIAIAVAGGFLLLGRQVIVGYRFSGGCVCPALVVSERPPLIAAYTDLSVGEGEYPAVRIVAQPLGRMTSRKPPKGTRLAAVALYEMKGPMKPHWDSFTPVVVNCGTRRRNEIQRVLDSIGPDEWAALEAGLRQIPTPDTPGLYPIVLSRAGT